MPEHLNGQDHRAIKAAIQRLTAEKAAEAPQTDAPPAMGGGDNVTSSTTPKPKKPKLTPAQRWPQIDPRELETAIADLGHQYSKASYLVLNTPGLSPLATAIYGWLDMKCFDGIRHPTKPGWRKPPEHEIRIGYEDIGERFGITKKTAQAGIDELRYAGFLHKIRRGANKWNEYELIPRRKRLEIEAQQDQRRQEADARKGERDA